MAVLAGLITGSGVQAQGQEGAAAARVIRVPVRSSESGAGTFSLQAFVYRPAGSGKHPLVVLSHGSSGGDPKLEAPQPEQARFFIERGYAVVVPTRRGRGASGGTSLESEEKNCDPASWWPGLRAAYEDVTATIDAAGRLPDVDARTVVLAGESRGGFLSVAYAAQGARRGRVAAVINFVGGWVAQAEDNCPADFNELAFRRFGASTRLPELWLYGDRDRFYATASIRDYPRAYAEAGGKVAFHLIGDVPDNGHWLPGYPALWSAPVERYLASRHLPAKAYESGGVAK